MFCSFLYSCEETLAVDDDVNRIETENLPKCSRDLLSDFRSIQTRCRVTYTEREREECIELIDDFNEIYPYFECIAADKTGIEDKVIILSTEKMMIIREQLERRDIP